MTIFVSVHFFGDTLYVGCKMQAFIFSESIVPLLRSAQQLGDNTHSDNPDFR